MTLAASSSSTEHATAVESIIHNLSPELKEKLDILTRVADFLGIDDLSFSSYSSALTRLYAREQDAQHTLTRLEHVERELRSHLATMVHEERLIDGWIDRLETEHASGESTSTIERRRETLLKKAKEYRTILENIAIEPPPISFADLTAQQAANARRAQEIKDKRARIKLFKGLPPDLDLARQQLKSARAAQMELIQLRERLLGRMADGVA
ncbi:hypothetical protein B0H17DRAFT_1286852 [Mycena rosella]|uniref:Uncharacterized protein n=1 Tax=Mycena rosella TaxID=1033263 RepID=A0AAD7DHD8_MYCRO|nr:hypothetical protein B0H17DRAFT_1286852 [Mycena rosella]